MSGPTLSVSLAWQGDLRFAAAGRGAPHLLLDGDGAAGPSPMDTLAMSLAGCMAIDVVSILKKGRHSLEGLEAILEAERAPAPPKRFTRVMLRFRLRGDVPAGAIERAIQLSREKYCSVWQSMRPDIELATSFERTT